MNVKSSMPRFFIAAMNSGFFFTSSATALNSSASQLGCTPSSASNETTARWRRSTTASHSFSFWRTTANARRGKSAPAAAEPSPPAAAASKRHTRSLGGSCERDDREAGVAVDLARGVQDLEHGPVLLEGERVERVLDRRAVAPGAAGGGGGERGRRRAGGNQAYEMSCTVRAVRAGAIHGRPPCEGRIARGW